jgi:hypothetical protein
MENLITMFALITGMAISVSLALLLEKAMFRGVMRMMIATPMMARARSNRVFEPSRGLSSRSIARDHYPLEKYFRS